MKQTNYYLFDFMDFDPNLSKDESLWKAWEPENIREKDGDILIDIPFQKQLLQNDMAPDTQEPQETYTLVIRAYMYKMLRLFITMTGDEMAEQSEMIDKNIHDRKQPLRLEKRGDIYYVYTAYTEQLRAIIDKSPIQIDFWSDLLPEPQPAPRITFYPDGDINKPIELSDDHFSPPRYDALPIGFCRNGKNQVRGGKIGDFAVRGGTASGAVEITEENKKAAEKGQASQEEQAAAYSRDRATISFKCKAQECFTGTGERFRKMDLSGQTFQLKNQDGQGVNNRRAYKNIPFYLSSRLYGVFYHTYDYCKLSLADHSTRSVQFMCDRATLDLFLIGGDSPEAILRSYRSLTGFPEMPPLWSFGIWMSRMTYFSAKEVEEICDRMRKEHFPCDVIHLDTGWFRTDWLCEWKFNPERFPDPPGFLKRLKENGFRVSLWQLPYVAEEAEQIDEARKNNYICKVNHQQERSGSNFSNLDYAGTIDFTYPPAVEWYKGLLKNLLDMGVACIKTDFGENIHLDAEYYGMEPERLNNIYALLYQKAAYEITRDTTGEGIQWARSAWAGCQRYPLHWGGDCASSWEGMAGSLRGGLHLSLSGFAFWSHDVPGYHSAPDFMNSPVADDVYVRWTQFGVFTSHIRYHGTCKREPWFYPNVADIVRRWWKLRYRMLPYIMQEAKECTATGWPMLRPLLMHYPKIKECWHIDDEYFFGSKFLVAPVMNSEGKRDIYLPPGQWKNFFTGALYGGDQWLRDVETPLDQMPVFVAPGTEIPLLAEDVECTDQADFSKTTILRIDGSFAGFKI